MNYDCEETDFYSKKFAKIVLNFDCEANKNAFKNKQLNESSQEKTYFICPCLNTLFVPLCRSCSLKCHSHFPLEMMTVIQNNNLSCSCEDLNHANNQAFNFLETVVDKALHENNNNDKNPLNKSQNNDFLENNKACFYEQLNLQSTDYSGYFSFLKSSIAKYLTERLVYLLIERSIKELILSEELQEYKEFNDKNKKSKEKDYLGKKQPKEKKNNNIKEGYNELENIYCSFCFLNCNKGRLINNTALNYQIIDSSKLEEFIGLFIETELSKFPKEKKRNVLGIEVNISELDDLEDFKETLFKFIIKNQAPRVVYHNNNNTNNNTNNQPSKECLFNTEELNSEELGIPKGFINDEILMESLMKILGSFNNLISLLENNKKKTIMFIPSKANIDRVNSLKTTYEKNNNNYLVCQCQKHLKEDYSKLPLELSCIEVITRLFKRDLLNFPDYFYSHNAFKSFFNYNYNILGKVGFLKDSITEYFSIKINSVKPLLKEQHAYYINVIQQESNYQSEKEAIREGKTGLKSISKPNKVIAFKEERLHSSSTNTAEDILSFIPVNSLLTYDSLYYKTYVHDVFLLKNLELFFFFNSNRYLCFSKENPEEVPLHRSASNIKFIKPESLPGILDLIDIEENPDLFNSEILFKCLLLFKLFKTHVVEELKKVSNQVNNTTFINMNLLQRFIYLHSFKNLFLQVNSKLYYSYYNNSTNREENSEDDTRVPNSIPNTSQSSKHFEESNFGVKFKLELISLNIDLISCSLNRMLQRLKAFIIKVRNDKGSESANITEEDFFEVQAVKTEDKKERSAFNKNNITSNKEEFTEKEDNNNKEESKVKSTVKATSPKGSYNKANLHPAVLEIITYLYKYLIKYNLLNKEQFQCYLEFLNELSNMNFRVSSKHKHFLKPDSSNNKNNMGNNHIQAVNLVTIQRIISSLMYVLFKKNDLTIIKQIKSAFNDGELESKEQKEPVKEEQTRKGFCSKNLLKREDNVEVKVKNEQHQSTLHEKQNPDTKENNGIAVDESKNNDNENSKLIINKKNDCDNDDANNEALTINDKNQPLASNDDDDAEITNISKNKIKEILENSSDPTTKKLMESYLQEKDFEQIMSEMCFAHNFINDTIAFIFLSCVKHFESHVKSTLAKESKQTSKNKKSIKNKAKKEENTSKCCLQYNPLIFKKINNIIDIINKLLLTKSKFYIQGILNITIISKEYLKVFFNTLNQQSQEEISSSNLKPSTKGDLLSSSTEDKNKEEISSSSKENSNINTGFTALFNNNTDSKSRDKSTPKAVYFSNSEYLHGVFESFNTRHYKAIMDFCLVLNQCNSALDKGTYDLFDDYLKDTSNILFLFRKHIHSILHEEESTSIDVEVNCRNSSSKVEDFKTRIKVQEQSKIRTHNINEFILALKFSSFFSLVNTVFRNLYHYTYFYYADNNNITRKVATTGYFSSRKETPKYFMRDQMGISRIPEEHPLTHTRVIPNNDDHPENNNNNAKCSDLNKSGNQITEPFSITNNHHSNTINQLSTASTSSSTKVFSLDNPSTAREVEVFITVGKALDSEKLSDNYEFTVSVLLDTLSFVLSIDIESISLVSLLNPNYICYTSINNVSFIDFIKILVNKTYNSESYYLENKEFLLAILEMSSQELSYAKVENWFTEPSLVLRIYADLNQLILQLIEIIPLFNIEEPSIVRIVNLITNFYLGCRFCKSYSMVIRHFLDPKCLAIVLKASKASVFRGIFKQYNKQLSKKEAIKSDSLKEQPEGKGISNAVNTVNTAENPHESACACAQNNILEEDFDITKVVLSSKDLATIDCFYYTYFSLLNAILESNINIMNVFQKRVVESLPLRLEDIIELYNKHNFFELTEHWSFNLTKEFIKLVVKYSIYILIDYNNAETYLKNLFRNDELSTPKDPLWIEHYNIHSVFNNYSSKNDFESALEKINKKMDMLNKVYKDFPELSSKLRDKLDKSCLSFGSSFQEYIEGFFADLLEHIAFKPFIYLYNLFARLKDKVTGTEANKLLALGKNLIKVTLGFKESNFLLPCDHLLQTTNRSASRDLKGNTSTCTWRHQVKRICLLNNNELLTVLLKFDRVNFLSLFEMKALVEEIMLIYLDKGEFNAGIDFKSQQISRQKHSEGSPERLIHEGKPLVGSNNNTCSASGDFSLEYEKLNNLGKRNSQVLRENRQTVELYSKALFGNSNFLLPKENEESNSPSLKKIIYSEITTENKNSEKKNWYSKLEVYLKMHRDTGSIKSYLKYLKPKKQQSCVAAAYVNADDNAEEQKEESIKELFESHKSAFNISLMESLGVLTSSSTNNKTNNSISSTRSIQHSNTNNEANKRESHEDSFADPFRISYYLSEQDSLNTSLRKIIMMFIFIKESLSGCNLSFFSLLNSSSNTQDKASLSIFKSFCSYVFRRLVSLDKVFSSSKERVVPIYNINQIEVISALLSSALLKQVFTDLVLSSPKDLKSNNNNSKGISTTKSTLLYHHSSEINAGMLKEVIMYIFIHHIFLPSLLQVHRDMEIWKNIHEDDNIIYYLPSKMLEFLEELCSNDFQSKSALRRLRKLKKQNADNNNNNNNKSNLYMNNMGSISSALFLEAKVPISISNLLTSIDFSLVLGTSNKEYLDNQDCNSKEENNNNKDDNNDDEVKTKSTLEAKDSKEKHSGTNLTAETPDTNNSNRKVNLNSPLTKPKKTLKQANSIRKVDVLAENPTAMNLPLIRLCRYKYFGVLFRVLSFFNDQITQSKFNVNLNLDLNTVFLRIKQQSTSEGGGVRALSTSVFNKGESGVGPTGVVASTLGNYIDYYFKANENENDEDEDGSEDLGDNGAFSKVSHEDTEDLSASTLTVSTALKPLQANAFYLKYHKYITQLIKLSNSSVIKHLFINSSVHTKGFANLSNFYFENFSFVKFCIEMRSFIYSPELITRIKMLILPSEQKAISSQQHSSALAKPLNSQPQNKESTLTTQKQSLAFNISPTHHQEKENNSNSKHFPNEPKSIDFWVLSETEELENIFLRECLLMKFSFFELIESLLMKGKFSIVEIFTGILPVDQLLEFSLLLFKIVVLNKVFKVPLPEPCAYDKLHATELYHTSLINFIKSALRVKIQPSSNYQLFKIFFKEELENNLFFQLCLKIMTIINIIGSTFKENFSLAISNFITSTVDLDTSAKHVHPHQIEMKYFLKFISRLVKNCEIITKKKVRVLNIEEEEEEKEEKAQSQRDGNIQQVNEKRNKPDLINNKNANNDHCRSTLNDNNNEDEDEIKENAAAIKKTFFTAPACLDEAEIPGVKELLEYQLQNIKDSSSSSINNSNYSGNQGTSALGHSEVLNAINNISKDIVFKIQYNKAMLKLNPDYKRIFKYGAFFHEHSDTVNFYLIILMNIILLVFCNLGSLRLKDDDTNNTNNNNLTSSDTNNKSTLIVFFFQRNFVIFNYILSFIQLAFNILYICFFIKFTRVYHLKLSKDREKRVNYKQTQNQTDHQNFFEIKKSNIFISDYDTVKALLDAQEASSIPGKPSAKANFIKANETKDSLDNIDSKSPGQENKSIKSTVIYQLEALRVFMLLVPSHKRKKAILGYFYFQRTFLEFWSTYIANGLLHPDCSLQSFNTVIPLLILINSSFIFLYPIQLFSFIKILPTLKEIIKAFYSKISNIIAMILFMAILIHFFAVVGFFFIYNQPRLPGEKSAFAIENNEGNNQQINYCQSMLECFVFYFNVGARQGGGIGDATRPKYFGEPGFTVQFTIDMLFFITIVVLILNMINGIIISTFSFLRNEKEKLDDLMENSCLVCFLTKKHFEQKNKSFDNHRKLEHNLKSYINFLVSIQLKEDKNLNELELDVLNQLKKNSISFYPIMRCLTIPSINENDDDEEDD